MRNIIQKLKEKKGFTLVELIVVLVILAILAALLIPSLSGYIDKANEQKLISETRMLAQAIQVEASTEYAKRGGVMNHTQWSSETGFYRNIIDNCEVAGLKGENPTAKFYAEVDSNGAVMNVVLENYGRRCVFRAAKSSFEVGTPKENLNVSVVWIASQSRVPDSGIELDNGGSGTNQPVIPGGLPVGGAD